MTKTHGAVALACAMAWSAPARAQRDDQRAAAQILFEQGKALVERGNFREACPKLSESLKLDAGLGTMLWLADCLENNGQTASAWAQFKDASAKAALLRDAREKVAMERAASLEERLSRLRIMLPPDANVKGLEVRRNGVAVGAAEIGLAVPVDPGAHAITASAPGRRAWSLEVTVPRRAETTDVSIPVLGRSEERAEPGPPAAAGAPSSGGSQRVAGLVLSGVGIAALGVGGYFALRAKSTYDDSNADGRCLPDNRCDAEGKELRDDASSQAAVATITMGLGAAALASGIVLYLTAPPAGSISVAPSAGPRGGSISLHARF